jgi:hypothetical protein
LINQLIADFGSVDGLTPAINNQQPTISRFLIFDQLMSLLVQSATNNQQISDFPSAMGLPRPAIRNQQSKIS